MQDTKQCHFDSEEWKQESEAVFMSCDNCGAPMPKICNVTCLKCGHKHDCGEH